MTDISRRHFTVLAGAALSGITLVPRHVLGGRGFVSPSDKLNIAGIGIGGRGREDLGEVTSENIVALADVDDDRAADTFMEYPKAKRYKDFRKMLETEKSIDAVVIATPDHTHAVAAMAAIKAGKHVYCEKPLTRTIHEARLLAKAAREAKVATQMGNQGMAFEGNRVIKEWLWSGAIGPVREVHVWSDRPTHEGKLFWAQGIDAPKETPPVPPTLDWDLWLGPARHRPYHPAYVPFVWRGWWDFGSGGLGDMGVHNLAPVFTALKLTTPLSVDSSSTLVYKESLPLASMVHYEFGPRGDMPPVRIHWYDGGMLPARPEELENDRELPKEDGILFVGDKGKILVHGWGGESPRLIPEKRMQEYQRPAKTLPRSIGHHKEWIKACKEGSTTESNFDFAAPLTEALLLGTISVRLGGVKLLWDSAAMRVTNSKEANDHLHYEYRKGWNL
ncbi:MAG: gfo/Idh/MocA family oxidoreductase [Acidobacteria bacterium]|nr:MAG: gfo/Idh/MocA family oxidoreductase [Acidobacteriota bacterium]